MNAARFPHLASELTLPCGAVLPNRIGKSAMSEALADKTTGVATEALAKLYDRWGRGGTGLLISGNVMVALEARGEPGQVVITDDSQLAELRAWADAAQAHGSKLWMQINHAGRQTPRTITKQPLAPSVVPMKGFGGAFSKPRALTDAEIRALIDRYALAASVARQAGFSGAQIHGAHGYLVSQFLSPRTNLRDDAWGGDDARRRADDAGLGAPGGVLPRRDPGDHAPQARSRAGDDREHLAAEPEDPGVHEGTAGHHRRVVAQVLRGEVVAAVHDRVVPPEQRGGVRRRERLRVHVDREVRPERPQRRGRGFGLPLTDGVGPVDHLAVEVGDVDPVVVDHPDPPDPRGGEVEEGGRPQAPRAHDEHGRREEPFLPDLPQLFDENVPTVPQRVFP